MRQLSTTVCLGFGFALVGIVAPDLARSYPLSGTYATLPGSMTSQGPFSATADLVVNEATGTATFQLATAIYSGSFVDPTTLHITDCRLVNAPPTQSQRVNWTFEFDTSTSFGWMGSSRSFSAATCSGILVALVDYTSVSMSLVAEPNPLPESGMFESVPGSVTSQGPFSAVGVLTVDEGNATATFQIGSTIYAGTFISDTTLEFQSCVSLLPVPPTFLLSEAVDWTFEFDTYYSFTWTGTSS